MLPLPISPMVVMRARTPDPAGFFRRGVTTAGAQVRAAERCPARTQERAPLGPRAGRVLRDWTRALTRPGWGHVAADSLSGEAGGLPHPLGGSHRPVAGI